PNPSLLYRPAAELLGKTLREVFDGAQADRFMEYIRTARETRTTVHFEYRLSIGGREVWFSGAISPMSGDQVVLVGRDITERRLAERDLRETLSLLNATLESTAVGILVVDLAGRIVSFNRKFAELWRIPDSVLEQKNAAQTLAFVVEQVAEPEKFLARIGELYARPEASSFDVLTFKDGRIFERLSQPQRIGGRSVGRVWSFRDVTETRRAERVQLATYRISEAAQSARSLQELFAAIHEIVGELMPAKNFYIALYDPATELLSFPYHVDEMDADFPSKRPGKGLTEYVLRTGQPLLVTPEVQAELERRGEVELIGAPSIDWVGVPLKIGDRTIGVLVAQTYAPGIRYGEREKEILQFVSTQVAGAIERHHAEAELRSSEARLKAIIDAALDAVITMDGTGTIRSWSPQAERVFGWPASEVRGRTLSTPIVPPRYREAHERGLAHFLATGQGPVLNRRIEITGLRRDGREIPVELTITPLRLADAWVFSAFVRDISERRQVEQRRAGQYTVTRILAEAETLAEAGSGILRAIAESLGWQAGVLWIVEPQGNALRCVEIWRAAGVDLGEFERVTREMTFVRDVGLPGRVWASDGPIWHRDVTGLRGSQFPRLAHATAAGVRGAVGCPIRSGAGLT